MSDADFNEDLGNGGKIKNWLQDNIRIILSVLIVVAIAAGIRSYSKRAEEGPMDLEVSFDEELVAQTDDSSDSVTIVGDEVSQEEIVEQVEEIEPVQEEQSEEATDSVEEQKEPSVEEESVKIDQQEEPTTTSEETEESFVQTAIKGDSRTVLARKALKAYLEKNNDTSLTAEHKIYIEDYLRKNVDYQGGVSIGTQVSFSKDLIREGIEQSKSLTDSQLENLKKYTARVSLT